jgi:hypothetical protein
MQNPAMNGAMQNSQMNGAMTGTYDANRMMTLSFMQQSALMEQNQLKNNPNNQNQSPNSG